MLDGFFCLAFPLQALIATLFTWSITALGACVVVLPVSAVVPILALRCFRKGSIVEQLRAA